jgi:predicted amidohydrolase
MARTLTIAAAQLGPIHLTSTRQDTLRRLLSLLSEASFQGAQLVVFPETALTTFFPRHLLSGDKLEAFFESGDITTLPHTKPLFDYAKGLKIDISIGYAERTPDGKGFNTCIYYSGSLGKVIAKYRKVHLPGTVEPFEKKDAVNQLEKRYFTPGDLGFEAFRAPGFFKDAVKKDDVGYAVVKDGLGDPILGMMICNDRRWPEAWVRNHSLLFISSCKISTDPISGVEMFR